MKDNSPNLSAYTDSQVGHSKHLSKVQDGEDKQKGNSFFSITKFGCAMNGSAHQKSPLKYQIIVPLALAVNLALYIASVCVTAFTLYSYFYIGKLDHKIQTVRTWTLYFQLEDLWNAGLQWIAIMIFIFTYLWPFIKLPALFYLWFCDENHLSWRNQRRFYNILDYFNRFNLLTIDQTIMLIFVCFVSVDADVLIAVISGQLYFQAEGGLQLYLIACLFSMVLQSIMGAQIQSIRSVRIPYAKQDKVSLGPASSKLGKYSVPAILAFTLAFMIYACTLDAYSFTYLGLVGYLMGYDSNVYSYSAFSTALTLRKHTIAPTDVGIIFIQIYFVICTFIVPFAYLITLSILWSVPMSFALHKRVYSIATILQSFSVMEMFALSVLMMCLIFRKYLFFLDKILFSKLEPWLVILDEFQLIDLNGDYRVVDAEINWLPGCTVLYCSVVLYMVASYIVWCKCYRQLQARAKTLKERQNQQSDFQAADELFCNEEISFCLESDDEKVLKENEQDLLNRQASVVIRAVVDGDKQKTFVIKEESFMNYV